MPTPSVFPVFMKAVIAGGAAVFTEMLFTMDAEPDITVDTEDVIITSDPDVSLTADSDVIVESD